MEICKCICGNIPELISNKWDYSEGSVTLICKCGLALNEHTNNLQINENSPSIETLTNDIIKKWNKLFMRAGNPESTSENILHKHSVNCCALLDEFKQYRKE